MICMCVNVPKIQRHGANKAASFPGKSVYKYIFVTASLRSQSVCVSTGLSAVQICLLLKMFGTP